MIKSYLNNWLTASASMLAGFALGCFVSESENDTYQYVDIQNQINNSNELIDRYEKSIKDKQKIIDSLYRINKKIISKNCKTENTKDDKNKHDAEYQEKEVCKYIKDRIDFDKVKNIISDIDSESYFARDRALKTLVVIGSQETKKKIDELIFNDDEDISLRRDIILNSDWNGAAKELVEIFEKITEADIQLAVIFAAENSDFSQSERQIFEESLLYNFTSELNDAVKLAIVDYFANNNTALLQEIIDNSELLSPQIQQRLEFLIKNNA